MFITVGAFFSILGRSYQMGTPAKMGSGYFPFWLGVLMALLGIYILLGSIKAVEGKEQEGLGKWDWKSVLWVTGSVLVFAIALPYAGLILSLVALVFISSMASHEFHWKGTIVNTIILNFLAYFAFVWGLKLQFPVWPSF